MADLSNTFKTAFHAASGQEASMYLNVSRFIGVALLFVAIGFSFHQFMSLETKSRENYLFDLSVFAFKVLCCLVLFLLIFKP